MIGNKGGYKNKMSTMLSLADPLTRSIIIPFVTSAASVGLIRFALGDGKGAVSSNAGIAIGLLALFLAIYGVPGGWPATAMAEKAFWLIVLSIAIGALADRLPAFAPFNAVVLVSWSVTAVLWFLGRNSQSPTIVFGALLVGSIMVFFRLDQEQDRGHVAPLLLLWSGVGLSAIAYIAGRTMLMETATGLVAALLGFLVWNIPTLRYPIGHAAILSGGTVVVFIIIGLLSSGIVMPLLALAALLYADRIGGRMFRSLSPTFSLSLTAAIMIAVTVALMILVR